MSYPDPRYLGDGGQISATYRPADRPPDLTIPRTRIGYLATAASTGGEFGLYRWSMNEGRGGADPHFHRTMSESFFVLSGRVRFFDGQRWIDGAAGDFLYVPVGGIHAFRNESGAPVEMLLLFAPGAPREAYFAALGEIAASGRTLTDDEQVEFLRRHDQYLV